MQQRIRKILLLTGTLIILVDLITMRGINLLLDSPAPELTEWVTILHWGISLIFILLIITLIIRPPEMKSPAASRRMFTFTGAFIIIYIPKFFFAGFMVLDELFYQTARFMNLADERFLFFIFPGIFLSAVSFLFILYGIFFGKTNLQTRKLKIDFKSLPAAFDGLKILHISDLHLGSLNSNSSYPEKIVSRINSLKPDLVLFTGDLVNNVAEEAAPWIETFKKIRAPKGKFAVLGNHDYGEYVNWKNEQEKQENHQKIREFHKKIGFQLLNNDGHTLSENGDSLSILGVENWGLPPFPQPGDLNEAQSKVSPSDFQILLSHDPSHWDAEVAEKTKISLTLAGHTHGFQFGVFGKNFKWSPVQYKYPRWAGLYKNGHQKLHISKGLGFIGFPGRVGMPPDVSLIELKRN